MSNFENLAYLNYSRGRLNLWHKKLNSLNNLSNLVFLIAIYIFYKKVDIWILRPERLQWSIKY